MTTKEALHRLVDELPDDAEELDRVRDIILERLQSRRPEMAPADEQPRDARDMVSSTHSAAFAASPDGDPVLRSLAGAPLDDESTTLEDDAAAEDAWKAYRRG